MTLDNTERNEEAATAENVSFRRGADTMPQSESSGRLSSYSPAKVYMA